MVGKKLSPDILDDFIEIFFKLHVNIKSMSYVRPDIIETPKFTIEEIEMIHNAVEFTKEKIRKYKGSKDISIIDKENDINELNESIKFFLEKIKKKYIDMSIYFYLCDVLGGALNVLLKKLLEDYKESKSKLIDEKIDIIYDIFEIYGFDSCSKDSYYEYQEKNKLKKKEIFLSYSSKDKKLAGELYKILYNEYRFDVFLAHELIIVSSEWRKEILRHLDSCDGMISLVTKDFIYSNWANQEVGYIMGKNKPIISLFYVPTQKGGFLESLQGIDMTESTNLEDACKTIYEYFQRYM